VDQPLPPGGGDGNVPTTPGSHSLSGGRGPEVRSFTAPQVFAPDVSADYVIPRLKLEDELGVETLRELLKYDREVEELPEILKKLKPKKLRWDP
jgi:hypothetical protein